MTMTYELGARTQTAIGDRPLFAVQALEIGRLTGHLVPLTPGAFIPISGEGDQNDSNGSGKTTFLAIVSLLLGDPQWRLGNNLGNELVNLLFDPELAGAAGHGYAQATHGYLIGAFGENDDVRSVWMRINRDHRQKLGPLQVRVYEGFVVARGGTDAERLATADEHWQAEGHQVQFGLRDYASALYGARPRVSAYVRSRGGHGSGPSLLAAEVDQFTPEAIGAELLRLCGQEELLQHDTQQRRDRSAARKERQEAASQDEVASAREDAELKVLDGLDAAREALALAEEHWDDHFAQQLVDAETALAADEAAIGARQEELSTASLAEVGLKKALEEMLDPTALREELAELERQHVDANDVVKNAEDLATRRSVAVEDLKEALGAARREAAGWTPGKRSIAEERLATATADHTLRARTRDRAEDEARRADDRLALVREQGRVETADALAALRKAGVGSACALFDNLLIEAPYRDVLEPALLPWRNAVVTAADDRAKAIDALTGLPGTILICGDDDTIALPAGMEVPSGARRFVRRLLDGARTLDGGCVESMSADVTVIAPLPRPVTGAAAAIAEAEAEFAAAEQALAAAAPAVDAAVEAMRTARAELARAEAADRTLALATELAAADDARANAERAADKERLARDAVHAQLKPALEQVATYDARKTQADLALAGAVAEREEHQRALDDLKRASTDRARALRLNPFADRPQDARVRAAQVGLDESTLRKQAHEDLGVALHQLGIDQRTGKGAEQHDQEIVQVASRRSELLMEGRESRMSFDALAGPLTRYLERRHASDIEQRERIMRAQDERGARIDGYDRTLEHLDGELESLGASIESAVRARLTEVSRRFDELDRENHGHGARLSIDIVRPSDITNWIVHVTPEWARGAGERPVSYRRPGNTAMKKQRTINLVLAALLDDERAHRGGVLVLDELGDSLGQQHRLSVLGAIAAAAKASGITVLATCQDSMLDAAGQFAQLVVYFRYVGGAEVVNRAPALYGYDSALARVRLSAEAILDGRPLA